MEISEYVEILKRDSMGLFQGDADEYKLRLLVGRKLKGANLYNWEKFGAIIRVAKNDNAGAQKAGIEIAKKTWEKLTTQKVFKKTYEIKGYHLGEPYETDDDGNVIGEWPTLTTFEVEFEDSFFIKFGKDCKWILPEKYSHLKQAMLPLRYYDD